MAVGLVVVAGPTASPATGTPPRAMDCCGSGCSRSSCRRSPTPGAAAPGPRAYSWSSRWGSRCTWCGCSTRRSLHVPRRVLDAPRHPGHPAVRATVSPRSADHDPPVLPGAGTRHERALERHRHIAVRQRAAADRRDAGADDGRAVPAVRTGRVGAGRRARDRAVCRQSELRVFRRAMGLRVVRATARAGRDGARCARAWGQGPATRRIRRARRGGVPADTRQSCSWSGSRTR